MSDAEEAGAGPLMRAFRRVPAVRALAHGPFAIYCLGNGLSLIGTWMQRVACGWLVWEWTGSGFWLGVLAAADLMPTVLIGPFGGAAADRWSRLALNRLCQTVLTAVAALLAGLLFADALGLGTLLGLLVLNGCFIALSQPARLALVQELVPRADVAPAVAVNSTNVNLARMVGPAAAGVMIVHFDIAWVFLTNAVVTAIFVLVLGLIRIERRTIERPPGHVLSQIVAGFRYVASDPALRLILLVLFLGGVFVRAVWELLPAFAARNFADTASGLAVLTSSMAFGAVSAGLTIGGRTSAASLFRMAILSWGLAAAAAVAFGIVAAAWPSVLAAAAVGHLIARGLISTQTFIQLAAHDAMRGRSLSIHGLVARASPALGAMALGIASDHVGLAWSLFAASTIFAASLAALLPQIRRRFVELRAADGG